MDAPRYSPRLRTGVVFGGTGTAGAYQAGVLRALAEAGIKIDVVAGHGVGAATALFAAVDGGARLWDERGPWANRRLLAAYRWRPALRAAALGLLGALVILLSPLFIMLFAAGIYALGALTALLGMTDTSASLITFYGRTIGILFDPPILPTIVPRAVVLALLVVFGVVGGAAVRAVRSERTRRRMRGAFWWRLIGAPLQATEPAAVLGEALWRHVRGASSDPQPAGAELGERYVELLTDNFGQPGFHEVLVAVHDVDARRDLVAAVLPDEARALFTSGAAPEGGREAETLDLSSASMRGVLPDVLTAALRLPVATAAHPVGLPADSYWRGNRHVLCDRPELGVRLIDELAGIGVEQVILVSAAPSPAGPHALRRPPGTLRGRIGALVRSIETAALDDAWRAALARLEAVFVIRPDHNPIGPFDFAGVYDEGADRERPATELLLMGYEDAYRQLVEPIAEALDADDTEPQP
ncbi:MAG TPA: patatin-like phospholipase family protein [Vicinamibacterales bacterium]|nr:patatin-like phospholipase family protein [Vicinamibacterales bacterium]